MDWAGIHIPSVVATAVVTAVLVVGLYAIASRFGVFG
jgi:hypothetical protein